MEHLLGSLRGRLATTYAGLALLAVIVSALYITNTLRTVMFDRIAADLEDEAKVIAEGVSGPIERGDLPAVTSYVARIDPITSVRAIVTDATGRPIAITSTPPPSELRPGDPGIEAALSGRITRVVGPSPDGGNEIVQVTVPIRSSDRQSILGAVRTTYNVEDIQDELTRLNATAVLGALGASAVAAVIAIIVATSVARPLQQVARGARDLARHQAAEQLPIPSGSTVEVHALVDAFNSLAAQLALLERGRREFASDISHELHSLASAMQTAAEALERGAAEQNPDLSRRLVAGLVGHTTRLNRLADDLLELARWESGRLGIDVQELDIADLVQGTLDEWTAEADRRGMRLEVRLPETPRPIVGDPVRLTQALGNVVENALKYAGAGGVLRVEVSAPPQADCYEVAVTDSGPGIPPDVLPHVFERYFRVEGRAGSGPGGMGLGLAIAREIARAHGGDLVADSPPEGGARFVLRLPAAPARQRAPATHML